MIIRVRDDDVLLPSSGHSDPVSRLKFVHDIIINNKAIHVPAILCGTVQQYPEAIKFIRGEYEGGRMIPELHGWEHIDYGKFNYEEIKVDLNKCVKWMEDNFNRRPTKFYTPWGASSKLIEDVAKEFGMQMVDCSKIITPNHINKNQIDCSNLEKVELFIHWWEGVRRLESALRKLNNEI